MPCFKIHTSKEFSALEKENILKETTNIISEVLGKPKLYIMGIISKDDMIMSDSLEPAMFVEIKSIGGLDRNSNNKLSEAICCKITEITSIPGDRIFLNFVDVDRVSWGWNSSTLGQQSSKVIKL